MWLLCAVFSLLAAAVQGSCVTNTVFFGDVNVTGLEPYHLQLISAVGTYVLEPNNVSLVAYRHIGRPDQFLLREPTEAPRKKWVVATLPDDKKPALVRHAYEAWPEAGNILAWGEFAEEPWAAGAEPWEVRSCDGSRQPMPALRATCVQATFGQCSTDRWVVTEPAGAPDILTASGTYTNGRQEHRSARRRLYAGADGRWRLASLLEQNKVEAVSAAPAERLEYVQRWVTGETSTDESLITIRCEPLAVSGDPCAASPCRNNGTCLPAPYTDGAYHCRCRFDSVSPNCLEVRECRLPPSVANGKLLFTSDLSPHGKAFYRCDVGYRVKASASPGATQLRTFAICDGKEWKNVPQCEPITVNVTLASAYVHHCDFDAGWCDGYSRGPQLTYRGRTLPWQLEAGERRGQAAQVRSAGGGRQLAILTTPCIFLPAEGCVVFDVRVSAPGSEPTSLTVTDDEEVTLWSTQGENSGWTTATLTLPPGSNRLTFEAVLGAAGARVGIDNVRVFMWDCKQVSELLFPSPSRGGAAGPETMVPLVSLLALLLYSRLAGVLGD